MGNDTATALDRIPGGASRRGAVTAALAGSALGLALLGGVPSPAAARNGKQAKKRRRNRRQGGNGLVGGALPAVRFVETSTIFTSSGVVSASSKCPDGFLPISGGFFTSVPEPQVLTSTPRLAENDWFFEIDGANAQEQMTVTAICLAASLDPGNTETDTESPRRTKRKRS